MQRLSVGKMVLGRITNCVLSSSISVLVKAGNTYINDYMERSWLTAAKR